MKPSPDLCNSQINDPNKPVDVNIFTQAQSCPTPETARFDSPHLKNGYEQDLEVPQLCGDTLCRSVPSAAKIEEELPEFADVLSGKEVPSLGISKKNPSIMSHAKFVQTEDPLEESKLHSLDSFTQPIPPTQIPEFGPQCEVGSPQIKWVSFMFREYPALALEEQGLFSSFLKEAKDSYAIAYFMFKNTNLKRQTRLDIIKAVKQFQKYSPSLMVKDLKPYVQHLVVQGKPSISTIVKQTKYLKKYLSTVYGLKEFELLNLKFSARKIVELKDQLMKNTRLLISTVDLLQEAQMHEESIFLKLTYSLGLSPNYLYYLQFNCVEEDILKVWDPYRSSYRSMLLDPHTRHVILDYESYRKDFHHDNKLEERENHLGDGRLDGHFFFHKKPTVWNNLFATGFGRISEDFNLTPSHVIDLAFFSRRTERGMVKSVKLPLMHELMRTSIFGPEGYLKEGINNFGF